MDGFTHNVERLVLDVISDDNVQDVVGTIVEKEGRIDVLVNNAGVLCTGPVIDIPMDEIQRAYDANVFSIIRMCKAVIPHMAARKSGTIVNISSIQAYAPSSWCSLDRPTPWAGIYASSKAAMHSLSEVLYMECTPLNIAVVLVTTGAVRSNLANNRLATFPGLPEGSLYARYLPNIVERVSMSQSADSMPTDEYARRVVRSTLQGRPPRQMRLGGKTLLYRVIQWLPRGFVLWLLWRRFSRSTK
ncbi:NADPH-dependent 1-acyldihydroxyacetone phosphate reductase [Trametes pubescens]|uniref:NADPH-dependent 1-acyldihydroxyacetone phosphate reductase n=1 Tax=Trametes pubescens TaxID=154538 RepID=A0A1M2W6X1_TRAPU|nr:NADPH-dependent 1-acyldihydroxyacetone phosphate reductase [Trametes pubescens]